MPLRFIWRIEAIRESKWYGGKPLCGVPFGLELIPLFIGDLFGVDPFYVNIYAVNSWTFSLILFSS